MNGILSVDDGSITFALGPLVSGSDLDVVLVPGTVGSTPAGPIGSAFSLSFDAATGAVLSTTLPPSSAPSRSPSPSRAPAFSAPSTASFTAPATPVVQPALDPQDQAPTVPDQPLLAASAPVLDDDLETERSVAFLVLHLGVALAGLAHLTPARTDTHVGLGRFRRPAPAHARATSASPSDPVHGGLGRFARLRTAPPQQLG